MHIAFIFHSQSSMYIFYTYVEPDDEEGGAGASEARDDEQNEVAEDS